MHWYQAFALTMTLGMVTPALGGNQRQSNGSLPRVPASRRVTEETRNMDCAMCGADGAPLTDCAQVNAQDDTNNEQQTANAENGFEYTVTGDEATITATPVRQRALSSRRSRATSRSRRWSDGLFVLQQPDESNDSGRCDEH